MQYLTHGDDTEDGNGLEADVEKEYEDDDIDIQVPMTTLKVDAKDPLELTITKTSLGLLQNLGQVKNLVS